MRYLLCFLVAILVGWLWMGFIGPSILRVFGVPAKFGLWRLDRRNQHLSKQQYVWGFGVFIWAVGMVLSTTTWDYLNWRFAGDKLTPHDAAHIAMRIAIFLGGGLFVGAFSGSSRHRLESDERG
jgi:hypothetical protein